MQKRDIFIGLDVSKDTLDICSLSEQEDSVVINNGITAIKSYFNGLDQRANNIIVCYENTGKYSWALTETLSTLGLTFFVVNPLHMKRSMGLARGKSDKVDAVRIAHFIRKNHHELKPFSIEREQIRQLRILLTERSFRVEQRKSLKNKEKDLRLLADGKFAAGLIKKNLKLIKELDIQIKELEQQADELIKGDQELDHIHKTIKSVPGVGEVLAKSLIARSNEFRSVKEPRKMACFAGVAPFENSSGTSIKGRASVSPYADKTLKKLLHMAALSAIRGENDLATYYRRKTEEGKNKMCVINAVRNKIIHIVYALVKNQTFYQNRLAIS